jgi:hypothetical protein
MARRRKNKEGKTSRASQMRQVYRLTKQTDPRIGLILLGTFVAVALATFFLLSLIPPGWFVVDLITAIFVGLFALIFIFGRRATKSQISQVKGKPGAALAVLTVLRRGWRTDQMIAFNRNQDVVHRVVGPPGIVLIGEGQPSRVKHLLQSEKARHQRVASDTPVHTIIVGEGEGEVPLEKLTKHVTKLGRQIQPAEMTEVLSRLKAIDASRQPVPLPKGPMPTSMKGMRGNLKGR